MFKQTTLASTIFMALFSPSIYAADAVDANADQAQQAAETPINTDDMETIEVVGIRSSLNKAVNIKRQSVQVVDAIVAEDIGKFPDNNVVEALQRVTGVQVTDRASGEVGGVSIRGLTDVTTTVNGREMFTAAGRTLAVRDIPAALLESVEVFKTRDASQLASGIAGQLNVRTQRPFNFEGGKFMVNARGVYQDQAEKTDPIVSALASNRWDTSIGEIGALLNLSYARTNYRDESAVPGGFVPYKTDENGNLVRLRTRDGWQRPIALEHGMDRTPGATMTNVNTGEVAEYSLSRDAVNQSDVTGKRERPAVNLSLQFAPNDSSEYTFEAFYNGYRNSQSNHMMFSYADSSRLNTAIHPEYFEGTNVVKSRAWGDSGAFTSGDYSESQTDSYMYSLGGKWDLSADTTLKSEVVYQSSKYKTDFVAMQASSRMPYVFADFNTGNGVMSWTPYESENGPVLDLTNPDLWTTSNMYDSGSKNSGDAFTFTTDLDFYVDWSIFTKAKAGIRYDKRTAESYSRGLDKNNYHVSLADLDPSMTEVNSDFFTGTSDVPRTWMTIDGKGLWNNLDEYRDLNGFYQKYRDRRLMDMNRTFDIDQTSWAAYIASDFETELFGKRLDGDIGVRYSYASADMHFWQWDDVPNPDDANDPFQTESTSTGTNSSAKFLPNLTLRYHLTDDVLMRFAYTETLRRPEFSQLNPFLSKRKDTTDKGYGTASGGNPDLKPVESKNYDFSLEYYFGAGSSVYGTYFYRDIQGFIFDSASKTMMTDDDDPNGELKNYVVNHPDNTSNGVLKGVELGAVYFPENVPNWLDGFGIQASGTFLDSNQDIPVFDDEGGLVRYDHRNVFGVSDTSFSGVLIYEKEDYSARLSYVWRDGFLNRYGSGTFAHPRGVYRRPEQSLDFQFSYDVTENLVVTFDATNLTNEVFRQYYEEEYLNDSAATYSRTFGLGIRYSM